MPLEEPIKLANAFWAVGGATFTAEMGRREGSLEGIDDGNIIIGRIEGT